MGKVITSLQFVTQSAPSTPPSTHGNIFASASTLYFINDGGQIYDLASSSGSLRISYYTGSSTTQTYTYDKLGNLKYLKVICVGAGGGGGSGKSRDRNFGTGGRAGGGGAIVWTQFISSQIPSSVTITVGTGGTGASSVTAGNDGNAGGNGGNTSFGTQVIAEGGKGGAGGVNSTQQSFVGGLGGSLSNSTPSYSPFVLPGINGGGNISGQASIIGLDAGNVLKNALLPAVGTSGADEGVVYGGGSGGGGGGGFGSIDGAGTAGSGSGVTQYNGSIINGGTPGAPGTSNAGSNGQNNIGLDMITHLIGYTATYGLGGGGHGGGSASGTGGNGGNYGAGGGGGGTTSTTSIASGAGGSGSPGLCILIEYF
jgi:hypothetical protein